MGPWYLWCRVGVSLLRRNRTPEYRPATGGTARCNSAGSPEATTRAHESLQRDYPYADGPNGLVIVANILPTRRLLLLSRRVLVGWSPILSVHAEQFGAPGRSGSHTLQSHSRSTRRITSAPSLTKFPIALVAM